MLDKIRFQKLYNSPTSYLNEYERGIIHGMAYFADKLIWAEQYYLDARKAMKSKENFNEYYIDMFKIINNQLQDYYKRANGYNLFNNEKSDIKYKKLLKKLEDSNENRNS